MTAPLIMSGANCSTPLQINEIKEKQPNNTWIEYMNGPISMACWSTLGQIYTLFESQRV